MFDESNFFPPKVNEEQARLEAERAKLISSVEGALSEEFKKKDKDDAEKVGMEKPAEATAEDILDDVRFLQGLAKSYMEDPRVKSLGGIIDREERMALTQKLTREIDTNISFVNPAFLNNEEIVKAVKKLESIKEYVSGF